MLPLLFAAPSQKRPQQVRQPAQRHPFAITGEPVPPLRYARMNQRDPSGPRQNHLLSAPSICLHQPHTLFAPAAGILILPYCFRIQLHCNTLFSVCQELMPHNRKIVVHNREMGGIVKAMMLFSDTKESDPGRDRDYTGKNRPNSYAFLHFKSFLSIIIGFKKFPSFTVYSISPFCENYRVTM